MRGGDMQLSRQTPVFADTPRLGRAPLFELVVVALLIMLTVPALIVVGRKQVSEERAQVTLSVSSDPSGASVIVDDLWVGRTPLDLDLTRSDEVALRVEAREPYLEYDLYKPFRKRITVESDRSLHVWIPRTSSEEQAAQIAAGR